MSQDVICFQVCSTMAKFPLVLNIRDNKTGINGDLVTTFFYCEIWMELINLTLGFLVNEKCFFI